MSTFCDLSKGHCAPCEGIGQALEETEARAQLAALPGWQLAADARSIGKEFAFKNFKETMLFVNGVAWMAEAEGHHPDLEVGYARCKITWTTHALNGLSMNDFIGAAKVEALLTA